MELSDLSVSTLLVRDERHMREIVYSRLRQSAEQLASQLTTYRRSDLRVPTTNHDAQLVQDLIEDVVQCRSLLGQVGWKNRRGE